MRAGFAAGLTFSALLFSVGAHSASPEVERANRNTVGIISGSVTGTYARFAQDLSDVLDEPGELRVIAMLGKGSRQNLADLLYLRGVDVAIVQSDVLRDFKADAGMTDVDAKIAYITKLYNEEIHILVRADIRSVKDLAGERVNFGPRGSGTAMTARLVFDALDIPVEETNLGYSQAVDALRRGELAGEVFVAGKPTTHFTEIVDAQGLHFLDVEMEKGLEESYLSARLSHDDYPNLIPESESVETIAVGAVMAVYNWKEGTDRYERTAKFAEGLFKNLDNLRAHAHRDGAYHEKWLEVDPSANLPGWSRFTAAEEWLREKN